MNPELETLIEFMLMLGVSGLTILIAVAIINWWISDE